MTDLRELPSGEIVTQGLSDLENGARTLEALLVAIASRRIESLGLTVPARERLPEEPELALYDLLCGETDDPFFAYRALLDGLDSFISSFEAVAPRGDLDGEGLLTT